MANKMIGETLDEMLSDAEADRKAKQAIGGIAIIVAITVTALL